MKYYLAYSFTSGTIGGTLTTHTKSKEEAVYRIIKDALFKEWDEDLTDVVISIKIDRGK